MSHPTIGKLLEIGAAKDAIHVAIAPVIATERLLPGQHIGFVESGSVSKVARASPDKAIAIGIVDPFLTQAVQEGQRFWMFLFPNTIQGLRHDWTHPSFTAAEVSRKLVPSAAEERLRNFAAEIGVAYEELIERARLHLQTGEYWSDGDRFISVSTPTTFWDDYAEVTGESVTTEKLEDPDFFSCSC